MPSSAAAAAPPPSSKFPELYAGETRHAGRARLVAYVDGRRGFAAEVQAGYLGSDVNEQSRDALALLFAAAPRMEGVLREWIRLVDGGPMGVDSADAHLKRLHAAARAALARVDGICPDCGGPNPDAHPVCADCVPPHWRKAEGA